MPKPKQKSVDRGVKHPTSSLTIRMPLHLRKAAEQMSREQQRSLNAQINMILAETLDAYAAV